MPYSFLDQEYAEMSREDAAWKIADHQITSEEEEYRDDNLLGTDRDAVCQLITNEVMEAFDRGGAQDPRIQLSQLEKDL